jgi:hypothetical protein
MFGAYRVRLRRSSGRRARDNGVVCKVGIDGLCDGGVECANWREKQESEAGVQGHAQKHLARGANADVMKGEGLEREIALEGMREGRCCCRV